MEPFTILCSTCQSRIRVRNANLLGQIVKCPHCDSMIMIAQPAREQSPRIEVEATDGAPVDSMAITKEAIAADSLTDRSEVGGSDDLPRVEGDDEYRLALDDSELIAPPVQPDWLRAQHAWQAESTPHIPSEQWTSDSTTKTRQFLLIGFMGAAGIGLAAVFFFGFLRWYSSAKQEVGPPLATSSLQQHQHEPRNGGNLLEDIDQFEDIDSSMGNSPEAAEPQQDERQPHADISSNDSLAPREDATAATSSRDNLANDPSALESGPAELPPGLLVEPTESPADAPASSDAGRLDTESADVADRSKALPKQLQAYAEMLQYELQPQLPDAVTVLSEAPVTAEELGLVATDSSSEILPIDWSAHSQTTLPGLVIAPRALSRFVNLWTNISGVPTVVDLDSLAAAGIDRNQPIALEMVKSATIGGVAQQLGAPLGLSVEPRENRYLRIAAPGEAVLKALPSTIALEGLIRDETENQWLTESLDRLIPEHPGGWRVAAGELSRPEQVEPMVWFSAMRVLETWRSALELPGSPAKPDATQWMTELVEPSDVVGLDKDLEAIVPQSRPVAQILPLICSEVGIQSWIDWPNLGEVGLGPQTTAVFVTANRPLRRALADYANQFSLVVAVVDAQSLWITSPKAYRAQTRLYVTPSQGLTAEQWQQRLRPLTPSEPDGVGTVVVIPTPDSQFMLIRCCRPLVPL